MTAALDPRFWRLFASSATSNLADGIGRTAMPLLAASLTRDPVLISALGAVAFLPWLLFAIPSGAVVDRLDRKTCMLWATVFRAVLVGGVALATGVGQVDIVLLYVATFLLGTAETVYDSAARAMLPQVVEPAQLDRGNAWLTSEETAGQLFIGAPVGSFLFIVAAWVPFGVNSVGFALAALLIATVGGSFKVARAERTSVKEDIAAGMKWLWNHHLLRGVCLISGVTGFLQSMPNAILVLFALQVLGISDSGFGILLVAGGIGGLAGGLLAPAISARFGRIGALVGSALVAPVAMALTGLTTTAWQAGLLFAVLAGSVTTWNVLVMSVRQALIPEALFGRVQGVYRTVIWGAIPIGSLAGGVLATLTSLRAVFIVAGIGQVAAAFWMWRLLRKHRRQIDTVGRAELDGVPERLSDVTPRRDSGA